MPGLSDMEELLSRIENKQITDYMREALGCYSSGAYRACIVLSYIAVFDDLRQKLIPLAKISSTARQISAEIERRADSQDIYETYMIDQLRSHQLITETDAFHLGKIRDLRNKSAHASGLHPSPEEARYVYFETIDKFLSREVLKTTHAVDDLILRLKNDNYFPVITVEQVTAIVTSEVDSLHPLAIAYLMTKLVALTEDADPVYAKNAFRFLTGLAAKDDLMLNNELQRRLITPKADDTTKALLLTTVIGANARLLIGLDSTTELRMKNILQSAIETRKTDPPTQISHPSVLLGKIIGKLGPEYIDSHLEKYSESVVRTFCYFGPLVQSVENSPRLRTLLVEVWKQNAASGDFMTANQFADSAGSLDAYFNKLSPQEAFELVAAVCEAAHWNAFSSINLRNQKFAATPTLSRLAAEFLAQNPNRAEEIVHEQFKTSIKELLADYLPSASTTLIEPTGR